MKESKPNHGAPARHYHPSEVNRYARKSTASEHASKSIEDQDDEMVEMLQDHGIPEGTLYAEKPGHSGDLWYQCEGKYGVSKERLVDDNGKPKHRAELSKIVKGILAGQVKLLACWAQDRLWRNVSICDFLCELMVEHGCDLYDRYGKVDITSPEGRASVRNAANNA